MANKKPDLFEWLLIKLPWGLFFGVFIYKFIFEWR